MRAILESLTLANIKREIKKTDLNPQPKNRKKADLIELMMKHKTLFTHIKGKASKK